MALLVRANGTEEEVQVPVVDTLDFLQKCVGGYIEIVSVSDPSMAEKYAGVVCNENGKLDGLPLNPKATTLAGRDGRFGFEDFFAGDCLFFKEGEVD